MDPFSTHLPVLEKYIKKTLGPILELGAGKHSTKFLRENKNNRLLITLEDNENWLQTIKNELPNDDNHVICRVSNWNCQIKNLIKKHDFGLIFVDSGNWESRVLALNLFKNSNSIIILHDSEHFIKNKIFGNIEPNGNYNFDDLFKYNKTYYPEDKNLPTTTVFSNKINFLN